MSSTNPRITTEWDDLQRRYGNYKPLPPVVTNESITKRMVGEAEETDVFQSIPSENIQELEDILEDDALAQLRKKRLKELLKSKRMYRFGEVIHIGKADFLKEVTEASIACEDDEDEDDNDEDEDEEETRGSERQHQSFPGSSTIKGRSSSTYSSYSPSNESASSQKPPEKMKGTWVITHVYKESIEFCLLFNEVLKVVAKKFGQIKFAKGVVEDIVPGYPESRLPLVLIYRGGKCVQQILGSAIWGGNHTNALIVEYVLGTQYKVLKTDLVEPPKGLQSFRMKFFGKSGGSLKNSGGEEEEEDAEEFDSTKGRNYSSLKLDEIVEQTRTA